MTDHPHSTSTPNSSAAGDHPGNTTGTGDGSPQRPRIPEILRRETVGGALLLVATIAALILANTGAADTYFAVRDLRFGYAPWHLELSVGAWAADGLLAVFFFLAGLELKREFVAGDLRKFDRAVVPVAAAVGGVVVPALIYVAVTIGAGAEALRGWAVPTATDIAFAVAVLAVVGSNLPSSLRIFLLTLAVVDDLLAITIIAFFYSEDIHVSPLLIAILPLAAFAFLAQRFAALFQRRAWAGWVLLLPLAVVVWALVHESGVHATVAGVLLGFTIPVLPRSVDTTDIEDPGHPADAPPAQDTPKAHDVQPHGLADTLEHRIRPLSAGFAVPMFAFFSAGVAIGGLEGLAAAVSDPIAIGIMVALVLGKPIGIVLATLVVTRATRATLDPGLTWPDVIGVAILAGVGFTVSLLISELGFGQGTPADDHAKVAILAGSLIAAVLGSVLLSGRNRAYRRAAALPRPGAGGAADVVEDR
ncbi:Na(+)/H(+) antiporter NhaA [Arthrobacter sp. RIT-PI-e]|uniref:Na+/H+ antiporter NhaA n=1 Tax=Arthrobacter sp. RIT-PI-e TaxID=1681197 RepID=UPI00067607DD|nr:Na+/H+ antiporter NhaA [Arthrobacter sp. RIT-PI-e]KNC19423.1 Na(+)/H(+) antiporter NhaA [Arthrobacter sp. RIT-PI-e]